MPKRKRAEKPVTIIDLALYHVQQAVGHLGDATNLLEQEQGMRKEAQERIQAVVANLNSHKPKKLVLVQNPPKAPKGARGRKRNFLGWRGVARQYLKSEHSVQELSNHLVEKQWDIGKSELSRFLKEDLHDGILEKISRGRYKVRPENNPVVNWHVATMEILKNRVSTKVIKAKLVANYGLDIPYKTISSLLTREVKKGKVRKVARGYYTSVNGA